MKRPPLLPAWFAAAVLTLSATAASPAQSPVSFSVLYSFAGADTDSRNDGGYENEGCLREGLDGDLYGTAGGGGANGSGTIFRLTPAGDFTTLHDFSAAPYPRANTDGDVPNAKLLAASDGSFYGATITGGANATGTVFRITSDGQFRSLYSFSASGITDGRNPLDGLIDGPGGNLYGVTQDGGTGHVGNVYEVTPAGTVAGIYSFDPATGAYAPESLLLGGDGNFYGVMAAGPGSGAVFRLTPAGVFTTLHAADEPTQSGFNSINTDGTHFNADLVQGADGAFYGTAYSGGTNGCGTIFRCTASGLFQVVYTFPAYDPTVSPPNPLGSYPRAGLLRARDGNFYGTTADGGARNQGTVFRLTPDGAYGTVYSFGEGNPAEPQSDGQYPLSVLSQSRDGSLYGSTFEGGAHGQGVIFKLTFPPLPAFFSGETRLGSGVYYLAFPNGEYFGYYGYLADPHYLYHFDLGYEYVLDAADGKSGVYLYDFESGTFFYTSPTFPFPYLYDFSLQSVLYYYPDPDDPGHYNTDGHRVFYDFATRQVIVK